MTLSPLAADFPHADIDRWREAAERALNGADFDRALVRRTAEGIARGPLNTLRDRPEPLERTARAAAPAGGYAWDVRAVMRHPDPARANEAALADLEGGASSLELVVDLDDGAGVMIGGLDDLDRALAGVLLDVAPVSLEAGALGPQAAALLVALWRQRGIAPQTARGAFNIDPLGALAARPRPVRDLAAELATASAWARWTAEHYPHAAALRVDARPVHEAGGSSASALAFAAASAAHYMRAMTDDGLAPSLAARQIRAALSVDADAHLAIAKLRAWRRIWARLAGAFGADPAPAVIDAYGSKRMLAGRDPWTNMLRLTMAGFAAGVGGADAVALPAFTDALGAPDAFARRVSRNIQITAMEEAQLGRVADPAAGGFHHEALTDALAREAWARFQAIEAQGGVIAHIESGRLGAGVADERAALTRDVATRKAAIIGVSLHALFDERPASFETIDLPAIRAGADARAAARPRLEHGPELALPDLLIPAAEKGADIRALAVIAKPDAKPANPAPLAPMRLAAPFERLRDAADAHEAKTGARPRAFIARLGPAKDHAARADWLAGLFAAGGIAAEASAEGADDLAASWRAANTPLAVLCGADDAYADHAAEAVRALKAAGATVWLAGRLGADMLTVLQSHGLCRTARAGEDALALLAEAHALLGIAQ